MVTVQLSAVRLGIAYQRGIKPENVSDTQVFNKICEISSTRNQVIGLIDSRRPIYKIKPGRIVEEFMVPELRITMTDRLADQIVQGNVTQRRNGARFASRYILNGPLNV